MDRAVAVCRAVSDPMIDLAKLIQRNRRRIAGLTKDANVTSLFSEMPAAIRLKHLLCSIIIEASELCRYGSISAPTFFAEDGGQGDPEPHRQHAAPCFTLGSGHR